MGFTICLGCFYWHTDGNPESNGWCDLFDCEAGADEGCNDGRAKGEKTEELKT
jgi:hypothetical protein